MRILFVSRCLPLPEHFGDRLILRGLLASLRRLHTCDVVALTAADDSRYLERSRALCDALETVPDRRRTPIDFARRLLGRRPQRADDCWNPVLWHAVERRMSADEYDVIHVLGSIQVYEIAPLVTRRPAIITPYESHALLASTRQSDARTIVEWATAGIERSIARRFERIMFDGFADVVVLGARDRDEIRRAAPHVPISVIPNGVRVPAAAPVQRDGRTLIFVGNFEYRPNVRAARILADQVMPKINDRLPDVRLRLVGAAPPAEVRALAGPRVEVTGLVPDVMPYLSGAACFVAPITQGAGLKNKVLEAMAAGVPVVTTPIGIEGISARDGREAIVRAGSAAIAEAVIDLLSRPDRGAAMASAARMLVEREYSWESVAIRYEQVYRRAIDRWRHSSANR
jgi:polysaccharide biosynthesis protein PslH